MRLITIPISHFCEKARWALDRARLEYREERHLQVIHRLAVRRAGGGTTVPVLVTPSSVLTESSEILAFADEHGPRELALYPEDPQARAAVERWEAELDAGFGPDGRRLMYFHVFTRDDIPRKYGLEGVPRSERALLPVAYPVIKRYISRFLDATPEGAVAAEASVRETFDTVGAALADGRPFLCGERFTAADLTFAALAAAVLVPDGYGVRLPPLHVLPPAQADLARELRAHPAGAHALAMYEQERRPHA